VKWFFIGKETEMKFAEIIPGLLEGKKYCRKVANAVYILQLGTEGLEFVSDNEMFRSDVVEEEDLKAEWKEYSKWKEAPWYTAVEFSRRNPDVKIRIGDFYKNWNDFHIGVSLQYYLQNHAQCTWYIPAEESK
jgi:hypothetical protein